MTRAAKKATVLLHPDRNLDDPDAASRFANLQAACRVFESEETRKEFDETGDVKQFEDLGTALKALTVERWRASSKGSGRLSVGVFDEN